MLVFPDFTFSSVPLCLRGYFFTGFIDVECNIFQHSAFSGTDGFSRDNHTTALAGFRSSIFWRGFCRAGAHVVDAAPVPVVELKGLTKPGNRVLIIGINIR